VLLDGPAVKSCSLLALQAQGRAVTTVEGLARGDTLHPLQEAFIACHGLQCGFCTPGMMMSACGLLRQVPQPSDTQIAEALEGNLCRCTGYVNIVAAVQQAARPWPPPERRHEQHRGSSTLRQRQAVRRIEDPALVRGAGQFTDDLKRAGQTHLVFLRSPHAHAVIKGVDKSAALALPGVLAVYSGADLVAAGVKPMGNAVPFPRPDGKPGASATRSPSPWTACASSARRWRGGRRIARSGDERAEAVMVDFDDLPSVTDTLQAIRPGAPVLCEQAPDNIASEMKHGDAAAADAAFQRAAHVVSLDIVNQRLAPPRWSRAWCSPSPTRRVRLTVTLSSQMPTARDGIATALPGLSKEQVRVRVGDVGGGFGMKTGLYRKTSSSRTRRARWAGR
jgi:hypothetical protein